MSTRKSKIWLVAGFVAVMLLGGVLVFANGNIFVRNDTNEREYLSKIHSECFDLRPRSKYLECMKSKLKDLIVAKSSAAIVQAAFENEKARNMVFDREISCHVMMHAIGRSLSEYKDNFDEVISACLPMCGAGCYHGIMEGKYLKDKSGDSVLSGACLGLKTKEQSLADNCFHGLGHAIAILHWNLEESLSSCDEIDEIGKKECGAGVFMELFSRSEQKLMPLPLDVPSWCNSFREVYQKSCWLFAASFRDGRNEFLEKKGIDTSVPENEPIYNCSNAPKHFRQDCFKLLGYAVYDAKDKDANKIASVCERLAVSDTKSCISGVVERDLEEVRFKNGVGICNYVKQNDVAGYCLELYKNPIVN